MIFLQLLLDEQIVSEKMVRAGRGRSDDPIPLTHSFIHSLKERKNTTHRKEKNNLMENLFFVQLGTYVRGGTLSRYT